MTLSFLSLFQALDACQSDSRAADDDVSSCRRLENKKKSAQQSSSEPQRRKDYHRHFRQRSASDANIATLHLSESYFTCFFPFSPFVLICLFNILISSLEKTPCVYCGFIILCVLGAGELKADCRGQQLSIDDLLEKLKEDLKKQVEYPQTHKAVHNNKHKYNTS